EITGSLSSASLTPAADIYSLAKTAYTMICGVSPRAFAHQPITELPAPISLQPWAGSLLHVLERATQTRPADRYQSVQDFWDNLNDVAMPMTRPLTGAPARPSFSSDLNIDEVLTAAAPPRPRFETSRELTQQTTTTTDAGREAVTTTDLNLRAGPNGQTDKIGLAEAGSRVQVITITPNSNWCEVKVLQHARPKDEPSSADRGWVNRTYLKF